MKYKTKQILKFLNLKYRLKFKNFLKSIKMYKLSEYIFKGENYIPSDDLFLDVFLFHTYLFGTMKLYANDDNSPLTKLYEFFKRFNKVLIFPYFHKGDISLYKTFWFYIASMDLSSYERKGDEMYILVFLDRNMNFLHKQPHMVFYKMRFNDDKTIKDYILTVYYCKYYKGNYCIDDSTHYNVLSLGCTHDNQTFMIKESNIQYDNNPKNTKGLFENIILHNSKGPAILGVYPKANTKVYSYYINGEDISYKVGKWAEENDVKLNSDGLFVKNEDEIAFNMKFNE